MFVLEDVYFNVTVLHAVLKYVSFSILGVSYIAIEYGIFGEVSQISTNQKRENSAFSLLIGQNMRPFSENTVFYTILQYYKY